MRVINSVQNSLIKDILKLQDKSRERRKKGLFIIEGKRELSLALKGGYVIENLLIDPTVNTLENISDYAISSKNVIEVSKEVYQKIAYRDSTEGVMAIVKTKNFDLGSLQLKTKNPLVLVLEGIEKPGNIGAMLRTADAANLDAVFIADPKTDLYNPNIIRSSIGCIFTNEIAVGSSEEICKYLQEKNINIYSATLQNSNKYDKNDYTEPTALVVGTEATGLTDIWRDNATQNINIPMQGEIDSMNVSVAAAILTFEAKRQREFK